MVILVNKYDVPIGYMEKIEAHEKALLHRAFSIFIFNSSGELLLQQRAHHKYHSGGLWTNTCCSHPAPDTDIKTAAKKRLQEEMGMQTEIEYLLKFTYKAPFDNQLTEHEIDHIFIGYSDTLPKINPEEVASYKYMKVQDIQQDISKDPGKYTAWFRIIFDKFLNQLSTSKIRKES